MSRPPDSDTAAATAADGSSAEVNPTFDWRYDLVSRRFRAVESTSFRFDLSATFSF